MRSCAVPALRSLSAVLIRKALFQVCGVLLCIACHFQPVPEPCVYTAAAATTAERPHVDATLSRRTRCAQVRAHPGSRRRA